MSDVIADLTPTGILGFLEPEELEILKFYGTFGEFGSGEEVVREGVLQDRLYYVLSGRLKVVVGRAGEAFTVGEICAGDCLGEVSIFEPGTASATVTVVETAVLWHLDIQALQEFFAELPAAGGRLLVGVAQLLCKRLRAANEEIAKGYKTPTFLGVRAGGLKAPIRFDDVPRVKRRAGIFRKK
ncbi:MAG: Crp/Fnr family transcriptional regulator [Verrucomicrobiia bacterium]